jgi:hypothetical protein
MSNEGYHRRPPAERIEIDGDTLLIDPLWCEVVLGGASRKTGSRLDAEGAPYVFIRGYKYRPLKEGRAFVASRIQRRNLPPRRRRSRT